MAAGQGFVTIDETQREDGRPDLLFKLDRSKIDTVGKTAIGDILNLLQAYKSTGNFAGDSKMFNEWGAAGVERLGWRDIVVAHRKPRRHFVQSHTFAILPILLALFHPLLNVVVKKLLLRY